MSNQDPTPISIEQDPAKALERVQVTQDLDNVIPFPDRFETPKEFTHDEQGELPDPANPQGVDRTEIEYQLNHADYEASKASIKTAIASTHMDTLDEIIRAAKYSEQSVNPDVVADAKSEKADIEISSLSKPAGAPASSLGSTALKINIR